MGSPHEKYLNAFQGLKKKKVNKPGFKPMTFSEIQESMINAERKGQRRAKGTCTFFNDLF